MSNVRWLYLLLGEAALAFYGMNVRADADFNASNGTPSAPGHIDATIASPAENGQLTEVVVTAQKQSENLQDVPIAVTAVSAELLDMSGVKGLENLNILVPGLNVTNTYGRLSLNLRGIGTSNVGPGAENPIALYIDGVYYASSAGSLLSLNNISDIEVLKGPQGTLFGRNATGGLIQITTKEPTQNVSGSLAATYGNYDTQSVSAYLGGGIASDLSADMAVYAKRQGEGWGEDLLTGSQLGNVDHDISLRSKWVFTPVDETKLVLIGDYVNVKDTMITSAIKGGTLSPFEPGVVQPDLGYDNDNQFESRHAIEGEGVSLRWDQKIGSLNLTSLTAYRRTNTIFGGEIDPPDYASFLIFQFDRQFTEELQLSSDQTQRFKWTSGLYYYRGETGESHSIVPLNYVGINIYYPQTIGDIESEAGYFQGTYSILDKTSLTLGGRYTHEWRNADGPGTSEYIYPIFAPLPNPAIAPPLTFPYQSKTYDDFTYRASLDQRFSEEVLGYLSVSTGFKAGGFSINTPGTAPYLPEKLTAYEIGLKNDLFDRHVRLNVAGFYNDYTDMQVQKYVLGSIVTVNGARARTYGMDADLTVAILSNLHLTTGASIVNPTFTSFPGCAISAPQGGVPPFPGSCTGNQIPLAAKTSFNAALDYSLRTAVGVLDWNGNIYYSSAFSTDISNAIRQPSFAKLGSAARWTMPNGRFSLKVYGNNLTNRRTLTYGDSQSTGIQLVDFADPRTFGITAEYDF